MMLLKKYFETIQIAIAENLAYRFNFLLEFSGPAVVYFFIKYNIWIGIYGGSESDTILGGLTLTDMLEYQSWVLIVYLLAHAYNGATSAIDIRLGRISAFLLYPFGFFEYHLGRFLGFFILQFSIAACTCTIFYFFSLLHIQSLMALSSGIIVCLLAAFYWFLWNFLTSIAAFWLEETWFLRVIMIFLVRLLSGSLIPLDLFPSGIVAVLRYTPFPYLTYYPVQIFQGTVGALDAILNLFAWIIILGVLNKIVWNAGVRRYSAAGI